MTTSTQRSGAREIAAVAAACLIGAVCNLIVNTLPAYLALVGKARGLGETDTGLCAMADLGGIALGTIACALLPGWVARLNWQRTALVGLAALVAGHLLSMGDLPLLPFLGTRLLAGLGGGVAMAVVYATFTDGDAARRLSLFNVCQLAAGALAIPLLGGVAQAQGAAGVYGALAAAGALGLLATWQLPRRPASAQAQADGATVGTAVSPAGWTAVASVFFFFVAVGAMYSQLAYMGAAWGLDEAQVEHDLSMMLWAAVATAMASSALGLRRGVMGPLLLGYGALLASIVLFIVVQPSRSFLACGALFGFGLNWTMPYQFAAVNRADSSSSAAMLVSSAMLAGFAIGPGVAGFLVTPDFFRVNLLGLVACAASLLLLLALGFHRRHPAPAGAAAAATHQA